MECDVKHGQEIWGKEGRQKKQSRMYSVYLVQKKISYLQAHLSGKILFRKATHL